MTISLKVTKAIKDICEKNFSKIPNCCGAYVIKTKSNKLYVGSSKTIRSRIMQHRVYNDPNFSSENIHSSCYYATNNHVDARILEYWLIREINPELNKTDKSGSITEDCCIKCSLNCETWASTEKKIEFDVNIVEELKNIPGKNLSELPNKPGVYEITTNSGSKYVGSATNLCSRLAAHNSLTGPNIIEPIKSVCCYITENRTDAYILEYAKIRELSPVLNKEFQENAWKWEVVELKNHFNKTTPDLITLFKELSEQISIDFPEIDEICRKDRITYKFKSKHLFFIKFMSEYLQIDIKDEYNLIKDSSEFSWKIEPKQSDIFHRRFKLNEVSKIDNAIEIIAQGYTGIIK